MNKKVDVLEFPLIVTVTQTNERVEVEKEKTLLSTSGAPGPIELTKKVTITERTIRTVTPYTGTV